MTSPDAFSLTRLFIAPGSIPAPASLTQPYIGGTLLTWDAATGANTVQVGPVVYTNLLAINPASLSAGSVLLAKGSTGYMIMGMSIKAPSGTVPGSGGPSSHNMKYYATASRSYDGSGNFIGAPDGDNNMYQNSLPGRGFGTEHAMWVFPGVTIRTDLTGATVTAAKFWLYCFDAVNSTGGCSYSWSTLTAAATTYPGTGTGGASEGGKWPKPGWGGIDILGTEFNRIISSNMNSMIIHLPVFSNATGFRGYGFSVALRPYIEVSFTL